MSENEIGNKVDFKALKKSGSRSKARTFADLLPQIEESFASGVRHQEILDHLNSCGFDLTMGTYTTMLSRARSKLRRQHGEMPTKAGAGHTQTTQPVAIVHKSEILDEVKNEEMKALHKKMRDAQDANAPKKFEYDPFFKVEYSKN